MINAFLLEIGVLLSPETTEKSEYEFYSNVYDRKHGYFNEGGLSYYKTFREAADDAVSYVNNGKENTYAVISTTMLPKDFDFEDGCVLGEAFLPEDVIFSLAKVDGKCTFNFVDKTQSRYINGISIS